MYHRKVRVYFSAFDGEQSFTTVLYKGGGDGKDKLSGEVIVNSSMSGILYTCHKRAAYH